MRKAAANPRTTAAPTMLSDSRNCGFAFMSRTAANKSAIRTLREIFRMESSRRLKNSDSSGAEARRSARTRLLVTVPRMAIRTSDCNLAVIAHYLASEFQKTECSRCGDSFGVNGQYKAVTRGQPTRRWHPRAQFGSTARLFAAHSGGRNLQQERGPKRGINISDRPST